MGQKLGGGCALFSEGSWVSIEHKVAWSEAYLRTKWHLSPSNRLATTDIRQKLGVCAPLGEGELGPSSPLATIDMGPEIGARSAPFLWRGLGPHLIQSRLGRAYLDTHQVAS